MQRQKLIFHSGKWTGFPYMFTFLYENGQVGVVISKNEEIKSPQHILKKQDPKLKNCHKDELLLAEKILNDWEWLGVFKILIMNDTILNQYGISIVKQSNGNIEVKADSVKLENFIYMLCRDKNRIVSLVSTINNVLANGINSISDDDKIWDVEIGLHVYSGEIYSTTEFDLYFENSSNEIFPLSDIKMIFETILIFLKSE